MVALVSNGRLGGDRHATCIPTTMEREEANE